MAINERGFLDDLHEGSFLFVKPPLNKFAFVDSEISLQKSPVSVDIRSVRKYHNFLHVRRHQQRSLSADYHWLGAHGCNENLIRPREEAEGYCTKVQYPKWMYDRI